MQLPMDHIWKYKIPWHYKGIEPSAIRAHQVYLERMSKEIRNVFLKNLEDLREVDHAEDYVKELVDEVTQHTCYCQKM